MSVVKRRFLTEKRIETVWPWVCGLMVWCVYEWSNTSGLFWGDSGEFLSAANTLGIGHPYGHPLFWLIGRIAILFHKSAPAAAMNHLTAFFSAATCVVVGFLARNRTSTRLSLVQRLAVVFTVTAIYGFSHTVWMQATFVEVYNVQALFLVLAIYLFDSYLLKKGTVQYIYAAVYFWGIAITLGLYAGFVILLPVAMWIQNKREINIRRLHILPLPLFFALGLSLWIYLPVRTLAQPIYFFQQIDSLTALFQYLSRSYYAGWNVPGIEAYPMTLSKMGGLFLKNLGIWGCLLFGLGFWYLRSLKEKFGAAPYLLVACLLILGFSVLIPLNMTFRQMDGMDVYYIPVLLMTVPILTYGSNRIAHFLRKRFVFLMFLPALLIIALRWSTLSISGKNSYEHFRSYLIDNTPEHATVISAVDEISYAYYYSVFALGNPKDFQLADPRSVEQDKSLLLQFSRQGTTLFDLHSPFLIHIDDLSEVRIAGPYFVFKKDSVLAHLFETEFKRRFTFSEESISSMHLLDRQNFALIWAKRGIFWILAAGRNPAENQATERAFQMGLIYLERACDLDDFSLNGASHAANLAFISIRAGIRKNVEELARRALRINPLAVNAHSALTLLKEYDSPD